MKALYIILLLTAFFRFQLDAQISSENDLYVKFKTPGTNSRLFVRWWWNGNKLSEAEILRQLDVMKAAGIGGVEINPIKFQLAPDPTGYNEIEWLSEEWLSMVKIAVQGAKERQMTCDMIVGSGWPFGGEFLSRDEQTQLTTIETKNIKGPLNLKLSVKEILDGVNPDFHSKYYNPEKELIMLRLAPQKMNQFSPGISIKFESKRDSILIDIPHGDHVLYSVVKLTGYMAVINGASGARGPVLNHFNKTAVEHFLNRMSDALISKLGNLGNWFRAFFVDSLELEGANWCDDLFAEFKKRRGYDLEPYYPYVLFKIGEMGNVVKEEYGSQLSPDVKDIINRVRYDLEITRTELFKERFADVVQDWCEKNNVKSRMQAYGHGYLPIESSMNVDIPECETWFNPSVGIDMPEFESRREYSMSNKFVSSAAHLAGKRIISCEEITNVGFVFNETLEQIKLVGDMSNLSGVTHSILHGYNYSPSEVPFPGWIQYGAFFSERNTWWKYFRKWSDYKARLSEVFQNSEMQADVAILQPTADLWTKFGAQRDPFPNIVYPVYVNNLWEAIHQNGSGCDYLSEQIIQKSAVKKGCLTFGSRSYKTIFIVEVETIDPKTVIVLQQFAKVGGKIVFIGKEPFKVSGFKNFEQNGKIVENMIKNIKTKYPNNVFNVDIPTKPLMQWYTSIQSKINITPYISINNPNKFLSQVYYKTKDLDIFFISNISRFNAFSSDVTFNLNIKGKKAWRWNPETGERHLMPIENSKLRLYLNPSESQLIVFDKCDEGELIKERIPDISQSVDINASWNISLNHINGTSSKESLNELIDFSRSPKYVSFAGEICYEAALRIDKTKPNFIDLGNINGVSELYLNDKKVGVVWYGKHIYDISKFITLGDNRLKVIVTTTLGNYCKSLTENRVAQSWTSNQPIYPCGMIGPVKLYE